jgi:hypothetical protein
MYTYIKYKWGAVVVNFRMVVGIMTTYEIIAYHL